MNEYKENENWCNCRCNYYFMCVFGEGYYARKEFQDLTVKMKKAYPGPSRLQG